MTQSNESIDWEVSELIKKKIPKYIAVKSENSKHKEQTLTLLSRIRSHSQRKENQTGNCVRSASTRRWKTVAGNQE